MSRVLIINTLEQVLSQAEKALSDQIHKTFNIGRKIFYQVGFSEHVTSWALYEVVGPFDKYKIIIRPCTSELKGDLRVDGRSHRLLLDAPSLIDRLDPESRATVIVGSSNPAIEKLKALVSERDIKGI
jgi:hypothetical protein